jgi:hypothetical protein
MIEVSTVAEQMTPQPTNKVQAAGTAAGAIGAVLLAAASFVGPALEETLSPHMGPQMLALVVAAVSSAIGYFGLKYGSQAAAFNVLDAPNKPLYSAAPTTPATPAARPAPRL